MNDHLHQQAVESMDASGAAGRRCELGLQTEQTLARDLFCAKRLRQFGLRYVMSAALLRRHDRIALVAGQRSKRLSHADHRETA